MSDETTRLLELIIETSWQVNGLLGTEFQESKPVDSLAVGHLRILRGLTDGSLTMTRVARAAGVTRGTATAMVDRLVDAGLVERFGDKTNRRLVLVGLTRKGSSFFEKMHERAIDCVRPLTQNMSARDCQRLALLLEHLTLAIPIGNDARGGAASVPASRRRPRAPHRTTAVAVK